MSYILFYGWQVGYRKITSVQLFKDIFQLTMVDAYDRTHSLLSGEIFRTETKGNKAKSSEITTPKTGKKNHLYFEFMYSY
ncbi:MAG: hypothetical protein EOO68_27565 [Moraxellaceae bacterium]|nr:MAG: hypothetical protein EOO68_27565 [Moraxellaceae bacterium]